MSMALISRSLSRRGGTTARRGIHNLPPHCYVSGWVHPLSFPKTTTLAILRETYDHWERRAPLTPRHVEQLLQVYDRTDYAHLNVLVQPSLRRIFPDSEYALAGATIAENLQPANILLGVKRPQLNEMMPDKTYAFFSHTVKGQPDNMGLLEHCLENNIQLLDYERMFTADSTKRLVTFGRFAGIAGAVDGLGALGKRLLYDGTATPLLTVPNAWMMPSVADVQDTVRNLGERIYQEGLKLEEPLVLAITGAGGNVHNGVMEVLQLLPHEIVSVSELPYLFNPKSDATHKVYLCPVGTSDVFTRSDGNPFVRDDFAQHPNHYRSVFAHTVAPYCQAIFNCSYWDERYPRLLTKQQLRRNPGRLLLVADIACDVHGSMECLERTTSIERPFFQYDPMTQREIANEIGKDGITVMGLDILPAELPKDSSEHFGNALVDVILELVNVRELQSPTVNGIDPELLSSRLVGRVAVRGVGSRTSRTLTLTANQVDSCITTSDGKLAPRYIYLESMIRRAPLVTESRGQTMLLSLHGHLFDSGLINQILDVIEFQEAGVEFQECEFPPHAVSERQKSSVLLRITAPNQVSLASIESKVQALVEVVQRAEAKVVRVDRHKDVHAHYAHVEAPKRQKRVLLLGAGRVSRSVVDYLGRSDEFHITVASNVESEARSLASSAMNGQHVVLDVAGSDARELSKLVEGEDLVISLLPAPMHPVVAQECVVHKSNLVTASYESDDMRRMRKRAEDAGVVILNEVGLDPGLDHMSAMKIIDDIHRRGGTVTYVTSVCGGLPAPEAADNPFLYKFSWNPKGVLRASQNPARFRWDDRVVELAGYELLGHAHRFQDAWPDIKLECLPNRDSLSYEQTYGIDGVHTLFRGTLRYEGFSSLMSVFQNMGLFDSLPVLDETWAETIAMLRTQRGGFDSLIDFVEACSDEDIALARRAYDALEWLGVLGDQKVRLRDSVIDAFCDVLERRLKFKDDERDMVVMHHKIVGEFDDEMSETHVSSLRLVGDEYSTAMSKTVGFTVAAAGEIILDGLLSEHRGLLLPNRPYVYLPILEKVGREGIVFEETCSVRMSSLERKKA